MAQIATALDQGRAIDPSVLTRAAVEALKSADPSTVASTLALLAVNQQLAEIVEEFFALNHQVHEHAQRQGLFPEDEPT